MLYLIPAAHTNHCMFCIEHWQDPAFVTWRFPEWAGCEQPMAQLATAGICMEVKLPGHSGAGTSEQTGIDAESKEAVIGLG